ncbi:MAG: hypothetical protein MRY79_00380 [Alphaproteobacteria bacterium]|nr:hypothetical protein [Alphaproteobacteria bacterium]
MSDSQPESLMTRLATVSAPDTVPDNTPDIDSTAVGEQIFETINPNNKKPNMSDKFGNLITRISKIRSWNDFVKDKEILETAAKDIDGFAGEERAIMMLAKSGIEMKQYFDGRKKKTVEEALNEEVPGTNETVLDIFKKAGPYANIVLQIILFKAGATNPALTAGVMLATMAPNAPDLKAAFTELAQNPSLENAADASREVGETISGYYYAVPGLAQAYSLIINRAVQTLIEEASKKENLEALQDPVELLNYMQKMLFEISQMSPKEFAQAALQKTEDNAYDVARFIAAGASDAKLMTDKNMEFIVNELARRRVFGYSVKSVMSNLREMLEPFANDGPPAPRKKDPFWGPELAR